MLEYRRYFKDNLQRFFIIKMKLIKTQIIFISYIISRNHSTRTKLTHPVSVPNIFRFLLLKSFDTNSTKCMACVTKSCCFKFNALYKGKKNHGFVILWFITEELLYQGLVSETEISILNYSIIRFENTLIGK